MTSFYDRYVTPRMIDLVCGSRMIGRQRARVVPAAEGRVLDVGFGAGANLPFYDPARVERLFALEPDPEMVKLARRRLAESPIAEVEVLASPGEEIPLEDASVDAIVLTYALCTIPDAAAAAAEMRRVLKPGGRLLFAEHGRHPKPGPRKLQERLEPLWSKLSGGCHLTRRPPSLLDAAGFRTEHEEGPPPRAPVTNAVAGFAVYHYWGSARPA